MKVIAGVAKGAKLVNFEARPTLNRIKEDIFNILGALDGVRVLDLYAGSGALGIEALSRGAEYAVFVERNPKVAEYIKINLKKTRFESAAQIIISPVLSALDSNILGRYDVIFLDPPYNNSEELLVMPRISSILFPFGTVVYEKAADGLFRNFLGLRHIKTKKYGKNKLAKEILFYQNEHNTQEN